MRALAAVWSVVFIPIATVWLFGLLLASFDDSEWFEAQCKTLLRVWSLGMMKC